MNGLKLAQDRMLWFFSVSKGIFLRKCGHPQQLNVLNHNHHSTLDSKVMITPVSLMDEIRTDGFGIDAIELTCICGMLIEKKQNNM